MSLIFTHQPTGSSRGWTGASSEELTPPERPICASPPGHAHGRRPRPNDGYRVPARAVHTGQPGIPYADRLEGRKVFKPVCPVWEDADCDRDAHSVAGRLAAMA